MLEIKFKKLVETAKMPTKAHPTDAGADLTAVSREWNEELKRWIYGTGIATVIPEGYVGLVFPRSSIRKYGLMQRNCIGVIDSHYRGEIMVTYKFFNDVPKIYEVGDKIAQFVLLPHPEVS